MIYGILLAAGNGTRTQLDFNKVLHMAGTKTILELSAQTLLESNIHELIVVVRAIDITTIQDLVTGVARHTDKPITFVIGGDTRQQSVKNALDTLLESAEDIVVIHDGARPFVALDTVNQSIASAQSKGSGIACLPTTDTVVVAQDNQITTHLSRNSLVNLVTPQSFDLCKLKLAYQYQHTSSQKKDNSDTMDWSQFTDDSGIFLAAGFVPHLVPSNPQNKKVTNVNDLLGLGVFSSIGVGFDVHPLVPHRKLILGGTLIPHTQGLLGHSDADVLTHAVMDALLSANGLPDIGCQFADSDPKYKGIDSMVLLQKVKTMCHKPIAYISAVILAQQPKLSPFIPHIESTLAKALGIPSSQIKISATTTEHLGMIGQEQGIAASALVLTKQ
ncbi:MAG: 2-C-methyl-D-erythritol 2,4-cyclodiphosphate synthase [Firmicutes bacterium]|nr:2-C-methyl-D-erythritol 2,4-cyclodiphosphate synthase [Bacillota bacterium]